MMVATLLPWPAIQSAAVAGPFGLPTPTRKPPRSPMAELAHAIDRLEDTIDTYGSIVPKQPDIWGEARWTAHRADYERILAAELENFRFTLNAQMRTSDAAFLLNATTLSNVVVDTEREVGDDSTVLRIENEPVLAANPFSGTPQPDFARSATATPAGLPEFSTVVNPLNEATGTTVGLSVEPTVYLDQLSRYVKHLNQLRRINEGDDTNDFPGYALNLMRIPVSVLPGDKTRAGYGAEVTMTLRPELTPDLLPGTFRDLVINDLLDQLSVPVLKAIEQRVWENRREVPVHVAAALENEKEISDVSLKAIDGGVKKINEITEKVLGGESSDAAKELELANAARQLLGGLRIATAQIGPDYGDLRGAKLTGCDSGGPIASESDRAARCIAAERRRDQVRAVTLYRETKRNELERFFRLRGSDLQSELSNGLQAASVLNEVAEAKVRARFEANRGGSTVTPMVRAIKYQTELAKNLKAISSRANQEGTLAMPGLLGAQKSAAAAYITRFDEASVLDAVPLANEAVTSVIADVRDRITKSEIESLTGAAAAAISAANATAADAASVAQLSYVSTLATNSTGTSQLPVPPSQVRCVFGDELFETVAQTLAQNSLGSDQPHLFEVRTALGEELAAAYDMLEQLQGQGVDLWDLYCGRGDLAAKLHRLEVPVTPLLPTRPMMGPPTPAPIQTLPMPIGSRTESGPRPAIHAPIRGSVVPVGFETTGRGTGGDIVLAPGETLVDPPAKATGPEVCPELICPEEPKCVTEVGTLRVDYYRRVNYGDRCRVRDDDDRLCNSRAILALAWAILVDSALLNERLVDDMRRVELSKQVPLLPGGFGATCPPGAAGFAVPFWGGDPSPEAREIFSRYVAARWPIHVFALDPVTQEQNVQDALSRRRETQLALSVAFASGQITGENFTRFARQLDYELETIDLNRTVVGFSHGAETFGWRFTPRVQVPPPEGNLAAAFRTAFRGGPDRDDDLRRRQLEPGARELLAIVIMPSFIRLARLDSRASFFELTDPDDRVFDLEDSVRLGEQMQLVRHGKTQCLHASQFARPGDARRLMTAIDQLEARLPLQDMLIQVPYENELGGHRLFSEGTAALGPELIDYYGEPGIDPTKTTTLFLVGRRFNVNTAEVIAGGLPCGKRLLSRQTMQITVPPGARTHDITRLIGGERQTFRVVDVHVATPYGPSDRLAIPVTSQPTPAAPTAAIAPSSLPARVNYDGCACNGLAVLDSRTAVRLTFPAPDASATVSVTAAAVRSDATEAALTADRGSDRQTATLSLGTVTTNGNGQAAIPMAAVQDRLIQFATGRVPLFSFDETIAIRLSFVAEANGQRFPTTSPLLIQLRCPQCDPSGGLCR